MLSRPLPVCAVVCSQTESGWDIGVQVLIDPTIKLKNYLTDFILPQVDANLPSGSTGVTLSTLKTTRPTF